MTISASLIFGLIVPIDADVGSVDGDDSGEDLVFVAQVFVHRVGEVVAHVSAEDAGAATEAAGPIEADELLRLLDGEHAEEDLIEEGEDGGVGSDAERERENDGEGEAWGFAKLSQRVAHILKKGLHRASGLR